jgi:UDP-N-acetylmuramoyl-tripeptide--D-alanyl-D-alanine ligase
VLTLTVDEIARAVGGRLLQRGRSGEITGVAIDSRRIQPGDLFFAIPGDRFDGHAFVAQVFQRGAAAAVVHGARLAPQARARGTLIDVPDVVEALGDLAMYVRSQHPARRVGVTGSVGKTTVKDLAASVLAQRYAVLKNEGNFNNEIGVPLTLFELRPEHQVAVLEMAMRGPDQIRSLARIVHPEIGVITNIGVSHLELLGSQQAIAAAKAELLEELETGGAGVLNRDDPFFDFLRTKTPKVISFGAARATDDTPDVCGEVVDEASPDAQGRMGARLRLWSRTFEAAPFEARVNSPGRHQLYNALPAAAVGFLMGVSAERVAAGLAAAEVSHWRMEQRRARCGALILNDAYNASPASMFAALDTLVAQPLPAGAAGRGQRIAVLGDMLELGPVSEQAHRDVGRKAADLELDWLVIVGTRAVDIARGAREGGMAADRVVECTDNATAARRVQEVMTPADVILVKGSRAMQMEEIVQTLAQA